MNYIFMLFMNYFILKRKNIFFVLVYHDEKIFIIIFMWVSAHSSYEWSEKKDTIILLFMGFPTQKTRI